MLSLVTAIAAAGALLAVASPADTETATPGCAVPAASAAYAASVEKAVASGRDLWGEDLLRAPGGPTLAAARRFLAPLGRAVQWHRSPLTPTGAYYVPLSFPFTPKGSTVYAL